MIFDRWKSHEEGRECGWYVVATDRAHAYLYNEKRRLRIHMFYFVPGCAAMLACNQRPTYVNIYSVFPVFSL